MLLLDADNAADYLRRAGRIGSDEAVTIQELPGGVSNQVLLVSRSDGPDFVVKQARAQLRVAAQWFSRLDRIWREVETLRWRQKLVASDESGELTATTPEILFEDREQFLFGMTAAPAPLRTWKQLLLAGEIDPAIAGACGKFLGRLHAASWENPEVAASLDDRGVFDELRLDPYYRTTAAVHSDLAPYFERLIDSVWWNRCALVHADFSPKNLLVHATGLTMIDFETGHYGDPAFDLGFFLTHLTLKAIHRNVAYLQLGETFWQAYRAELQPKIGDAAYNALSARAMQNLAGCLMARVDGKSPVEYLTDATKKEVVRRLSRRLFTEPPRGWNVEWLESELRDGQER